jgi:hypothetical protein
MLVLSAPRPALCARRGGAACEFGGRPYIAAPIAPARDWRQRRLRSGGAGAPACRGHAFAAAPVWPRHRPLIWRRALGVSAEPSRGAGWAARRAANARLLARRWGPRAVRQGAGAAGRRACVGAWRRGCGAKRKRGAVRVGGRSAGRGAVGMALGRAASPRLRRWAWPATSIQTAACEEAVHNMCIAWAHNILGYLRPSQIWPWSAREQGSARPRTL